MLSVEQIKEELKKRGLKTNDINKVIAEYLEEKDSNQNKMFLIIIYWLSLLVTIVANFLVTIVVLLFLFTLPLALIYFIVILIALGFGLLMMLLLKDIRKLDSQHYVVISIFFPAIAFVNVFIITTVANLLKNSFSVNIPNPLIVSLVYVYAFSSPYLYVLLKEGFEHEEELKLLTKKTEKVNNS